MKTRTAKLLSLSVMLSTLGLGGCAWFDAVGEHFPVIGERCENWQCFTQSGQEQSRLIAAQKQKAQEQQDALSPVPANAKPINGPDTIPPQAPVDPMAQTAPAGQVAPASQPATAGVPHSHVEYIDTSKFDAPQAPAMDTDNGWLR